MANTSLTGTSGTAASALGTGGGTSTAGLADFAAPYITDYLGRAQALANKPYEVYKGPLTAGESQLQTDAFKGIGALTIGNRGAYTPVGGSFTDQYSYPSGASGAGGAGGNNRPYIGGANYANSGTPNYGNLSPEMVASQSGSSSLGGFGTSGGTGLVDPTTGRLDLGTAGIAGGMPPYAAMGMGPVAQTEEMRNMALDHSDYPIRTSPNQGGGFTSAGSNQPRSVAEQYMNPYLQQALDPQLRELQRQSDIARVADAGRLTQAGAFGGSRQAIMESEGRRNLLGKQSDVLGQGYATAYDKAMQQYNAEQNRNVNQQQFGADFGLRGLAAEQGILKDQLTAGGIQRGITSEGIAADLEEFNRQRDDPYKKVQFQRDMISGLPTGSVTNTPAQLSGIAQLIASVGGIDKLLTTTGQGSLGDLLNNLGLNFGGGE